MKSLLLPLIAGALVLAGSARAADSFDYDALKEKARALAAQPYRERASRVPDSLRQLSYDQRRDIRYRPDATFWRSEKLPFQLQFLHPGFNQTHTVDVSLVIDGAATPVPFKTAYFDYGKNHDLGPIPADMGFSGFRVLTALNGREPIDELIVFEGASYFRALGRGLFYGLSARGLAVDTGEPTPEEFPVFESFWVERPAPAAKSITIYALLDSRRVAGAYRMVVTPGDDTVVEVTATLYRREPIKVLGLGALTSMFWFGENSPDHHDDLRPEVHDSDGLLMARGNGEWLWRPLVNPKTVSVSSFMDENPRGFGLLQRDRNFSSYQDMEAHYHRRPSGWVEPLGGWGKGAVRLLKIPTPDETNDNIAVCWVPAVQPPIGQPMEFSYRLHWFGADAGFIEPADGGRAIATRIGRTMTHEPDLVRFWVDFAGPELTKVRSDGGLEGVVTVGEGGELVHSDVQRNEEGGSWRLSFALRSDGSGKPVELRGFLRKGDESLTETWTYLWTP